MTFVFPFPNTWIWIHWKQVSSDPYPFSELYKPQESIDLFFKVVLTDKNKGGGWIFIASVLRNQVAWFHSIAAQRSFSSGLGMSWHDAEPRAPFLLTDYCSLAIAWLQYYKSRICKIKVSVELINCKLPPVKLDKFQDVYDRRVKGLSCLFAWHYYTVICYLLMESRYNSTEKFDFQRSSVKSSLGTNEANNSWFCTKVKNLPKMIFFFFFYNGGGMFSPCADKKRVLLELYQRWGNLSTSGKND